jgi:rhamnogalacturonan endolyase
MTLRRLGALLATIVMVTTAMTLTTASSAAADGVGPYQVINYNSGLCIDIEDASVSSGALVHQWTCKRGTNQLWNFVTQPSGAGHFLMIPQNSFWRVQQECMAIPSWSRTVGTDARQEDCAPAPWNFTNQGWSLVQGGGSSFPTPGYQYRYRFVNEFSQMCLEIQGASTSRGAPAQQAPCDGSAKQFWIVVP